MPVDAKIDYVALDGYPLERLYENLRRLPARSMIIAIDACFSGEAADTTGQVNPLRSYAGPIVVKPIPDEIPKTAAVMTAASGIQLASWYPEKRHSLFTYYLLAGLKGAADSNQDKRIVLSELQAYLNEYVPFLARRIYHREQVPEIKGDPNWVLVELK